MKCLIGLFLLSCLFGVSQAGTPLASDAEVNKPVIDFAEQLIASVKDKDHRFIYRHLAYPIAIYFDGNKLIIPGEDAMRGTYADWMTPYLYDLITKTPPAKLVKLLQIRKDKDGVYRVHYLLFAGDPADFRYSDDGIYSAKDLLHVIAVLKKGAKEHCEKCVVRVIEYPIWGCINGKSTKIDNEAEFEKYYDQIVTPEVKELMLHAWDRHDWTGIQDKGIMLGPHGDIWIGSFGHKNPQGFYVWETKVWALREVGSCP